MNNILEGNAFVFGNNVDTDQIYPGRFVEFTNTEDIKKYAMIGADSEFTKKVKNGDIIVAGTNFGCGSSREHAAITLKGVGVSVVVAESFGRIFYRNAINLGLALIICPNISQKIKNQDKIKIDLGTGNITKNSEIIAKGDAISEYVMDILKCGGIKPMIKKQLEG